MLPLHWLLPTVKGIPILMYHRVSTHLADGLTVTTTQLDQQFQYLKTAGYEAIDMGAFLALVRQNSSSEELNKKVLITFDDAYQSQLTYAYPLLKKYGFAATIFVIADSLEGNILPDDELNRKLTTEELKSMDSKIIQLGMHGYHHENFKETPIDELQLVMKKSKALFDVHGLSFSGTFAYPYGARSETSVVSKEFQNIFIENGVTAAFRIGNRRCKVPTKNIFDLCRIDIRGTDSFDDFKIKLKKGKLKPF